jgi:GTPase
MKFVDEASLFVKAGDGGRGCVSFRREAYVPRGGPDGGDGGKGGDVVIVGQKNLISLLDFKYKRHYKAENGRLGSGKNKTGRNGKDAPIHVPVGTLIYDNQTNKLIADIVEDGQSCVVAQGGRGGRGNTRFATPLHKAPREFDPGGKGEERHLRLELKILADTGIIGLPNAGKSTLLSALTKATPEIGDYPFTTLSPALGVLADDQTTTVIAEIPGIVEGASTGKGLGLTFLRHIERTRLLLWVIDGASPSPLRDYQTLYTELSLYDKGVLDKERILVLNKMDRLSPVEATDARSFSKGLKETVVEVSALTGSGVEGLKRLVRERAVRRMDG